MVRLTHYLQGTVHAIYAMLYSDDGWLVGRTERFEIGLMLHLLILVTLGAPMAWHKLGGGIQSEWVGYALDVGRFEIGISESRARWAITWLEDKVRERRIRFGELRDGLGRLQLLAGLLEEIRPFLGPLYSWSCAGPRFARPRLPAMLLLILKFIAELLKHGRMSECRSRTKDLGEVFRLDAKAEGEEVAIGGWRSIGAKRTEDAPWFAVRLNRRNAPWAFARGEAFRTIASLELLGALVGLMVLVPDDLLRAETVGTATFTCGTDNQGNSFLLDKLLTTKYPLGVVLMELACQASRKKASLRARWIPRLQNEEADALTNSEFHHFRPENRIEVDLESLGFLIMPSLFETGEAYMKELELLKEGEKLMCAAEGKASSKKRAKQDPLRERDPW